MVDTVIGAFKELGQAFRGETSIPHIWRMHLVPPRRSNPDHSEPRHRPEYKNTSELLQCCSAPDLSSLRQSDF